MSVRATILPDVPNGLTNDHFEFLMAVRQSLADLIARAETEIAGAASSITADDLTAARALVSDGAGKVAASTVTTTQLGYVPPMKTKLDRWINVVDDYGADNTGTIDAHVQIQAAIDANPGRTIWCPKGRYRIGDTVHIRTPGTSLVGEAFAARPFGTYQSYEQGVVWSWTGAAGGGPMLRVHSETAGVDVSGIEVRGIQFDGANSAAIGIRTESCVSSCFSNFKVADFTQIQLHVTGDDSNGTYSQSYGSLKNTYNVSFKDFYLKAPNGGSGVCLKLGAVYGVNDKREHPAFVLFEHFHFSHDDGNCLELANCDDISFYHGSTSMESGGTGESCVCRANDYGRVYTCSFKDVVFGGYHPSALTITGVTTNSKNELRVTTSAAHGRTTGDQVDISRAKGIMGLNGRHTVTVVDSDHLDLDGTYYVKGACTYAKIETTKSPRVVVEGTETGKTEPATDLVFEMRGADYSHLFKIGIGCQVHYEKFSLGSSDDFYHKNFSRLRFDPGTLGATDDNSNVSWDPRMWDWYEESELPYYPALVDGTAETSIENVSDSSGLIKITKTGHGRSTGDRVWVSQVGGVPQSRGYWSVTVLDVDNFTLDGSFWCSAFAYTSGGKYALCAITNTTYSRMSWTRSGNRVQYQIDLVVATSGHAALSGALFLRGLPPFTAMSAGGRSAPAVFCSGVNLPANFTKVGAAVENANLNADGPRIALYLEGDDQPVTSLTAADLSATNNLNLVLTGHYETYGTIESEYAIHREVEF